MATGLGAFTEGLQGGMAARQKYDLNKQYQRILSDRGDIADRAWNVRQAADEADWMYTHKKEGMTAEQAMEGYTPNQRTVHKDPALMRLGKFLGGKIKGAFGSQSGVPEADFASPEIAPTSPVQAQAQGGSFQQGQGIPGQGGPMQPPMMADGGSIDDEMERQRALGRRTTGTLNRVPETAGGVGPDMMRDIGRGVTEGAFDDTTRAWGAADEAMGERSRAISEAEGARETGGAIRDWMWEGTKGTIKTVAALAKDVVVDNPLVQGALGFAGMDGGGEQGIPTLQQGGEYPIPDDFDPNMKLATDNAIDAPDKTDGQMAEEAMNEGEIQALENPDFAKMAAEGTRPDDLPTMTTLEWADYRSAMFQQELERGAGVKEAYEAVEFATVEVQMRGFQRGAQQAAQFLIGGHNEEAALALTNAYQYFPNGAGIRFGSVTDPKTGLPALIAMGTDEETGEPTGAPMLITNDRLSTMVAQMSDPKAFSAWTKDGHQLQLDIAKLEETQKHHTAMEGIYATNAETAQMRALASGESGGLSASEMRLREGVYRDVISQDLDLALDNPEHARSLARAMTKLESMYPGIDQNAVVDEVYRAYEADRKNMSGVEALINPQAQQTGIPEG